MPGTATSEMTTSGSMCDRWSSAAMSAVGHAYVLPQLRQQAAHHVYRRLIVVHQQHLKARQCAPCATAARGLGCLHRRLGDGQSHEENRFPDRDLRRPAPFDPPCISTSVFTMVSPRAEAAMCAGRRGIDLREAIEICA